MNKACIIWVLDSFRRVIFIKNKKQMVLISLMLLVLIIKIAFPSGIVKYQNSKGNEVNQKVIKLPSESNTSVLNKDGEKFNVGNVLFNIYNFLAIALSITVIVFAIYFLQRRFLFEGNKKLYYISTIYFNVSKYKGMNISF